MITRSTLQVRIRGFLARFTGGDRTGLTVRCDGRCGCSDVHTGHLAPGALDYLGPKPADPEDEP